MTFCAKIAESVVFVPRLAVREHRLLLVDFMALPTPRDRGAALREGRRGGKRDHPGHNGEQAVSKHVEPDLQRTRGGIGACPDSRLASKPAAR
jgi:hypothetical protein